MWKIIRQKLSVSARRNYCVQQKSVSNNYDVVIVGGGKFDQFLFKFKSNQRFFIYALWIKIMRIEHDEFLESE